MLPEAGWHSVSSSIIGPILSVPLPELWTMHYGDGITGDIDLITLGHVNIVGVGNIGASIQATTNDDYQLGFDAAAFQFDAYGVILIDSIEPEFEAPEIFMKDGCVRIATHKKELSCIDLEVITFDSDVITMDDIDATMDNG